MARMGERTGSHRIPVGKSESKRPLGRTRSRWEDNIKLDLEELGWEAMEWNDLAQDIDKLQDLVNTVMTLGFHRISGIS